MTALKLAAWIQEVEAWVEQVERGRAFPTMDSELPELPIRVPCSVVSINRWDPLEAASTPGERMMPRPKVPYRFPPQHPLSIECPVCHSAANKVCRVLPDEKLSHDELMRGWHPWNLAPLRVGDIRYSHDERSLATKQPRKADPKPERLIGESSESGYGVRADGTWGPLFNQ